MEGPGHGASWRTVGAYALMLAAAAAAILSIRHLGGGLLAPPPAVAGGETQGASHDVLAHVLLALLVVILAARGLVPPRWTGLGWREATTLGVLMNTRGLMELIVLNVGLELRLISETLFAMMVLMAVVTTVATGPLLGLLLPAASREAGVRRPVPR